MYISNSIREIHSVDLNVENVFFDGTIEDWCKIKIFGCYSNPMYYSNRFYIVSSDGHRYYKGKTYKEIIELVLPNSVSYVGAFQFYGLKSLLKVVIPECVKFIGDDAFAETGVFIVHFNNPNKYIKTDTSAFPMDQIKEINKKIPKKKIEEESYKFTGGSNECGLKEALDGDEYAYYNLYGEFPSNDDW
jgi:hypothetical protein